MHVNVNDTKNFQLNTSLENSEITVFDCFVNLSLVIFYALIVCKLQPHYIAD